MADYRFYKYRKINSRFLNSLEGGTIYFSHQKDLNDPFDCELDIKKAISNAADDLGEEGGKKLIKLLKRNGEFERFQANVNKLGIFSSCFEVDENQTLLWSHYADDHKGACVLYEMPMAFLDDEKNILGVSKVSYKQDSLIEWFKALVPKLPVSHYFLITELLKRVLTAKSPPLRYECEVRIIRPTAGSFEIDKSFIKQIRFGLQASDEDIEKVSAIVKNYKSKVSLYKAIRGNKDFGIEYEEI
jgi:hypothetical protein